MKVSCIIPFHNAGAYFRPAVESVLAQDRRPEEIILVDDGSTDGSGDVAREYAGSVVLVNQDHCGVAAARNRGLREASGDVIAFHDADDLWPPGRMATLATALDEHPDADIVAGRIEILAERELTAAEQRNFHEGHRPAHLGSMLIRRRLFERIGVFNEALVVAEDLELIMRGRDRGSGPNSSTRSPSSTASTRLTFRATSSETARTSLTPCDRSRCCGGARLDRLRNRSDV